MTTPSGQTAFIDSLTSAWLERDWSTLAAMYHCNAVLVPPDAGPALVGRASIVDTYRDFYARAQLNHFRIVETREHHFAHSHVVHCDFEIDYCLDDQRSRDCGTDIYLLEASDPAALQIIWRQQTITHIQSIDP